MNLVVRAGHCATLPQAGEAERQRSDAVSSAAHGFAGVRYARAGADGRALLHALLRRPPRSCGEACAFRAVDWGQGNPLTFDTDRPARAAAPPATPA